jgi:hypothetical protein
MRSLAKRWPVILVALIAPPLGGCVAGLALGAANMAASAAQRPGASNEHLKPAARAACSQRAAAHGPVHIIDVEQRSVDRIVVWGTVETAKGKLSFECGFKTAIAYFKLREIKRRQ